MKNEKKINEFTVKSGVRDYIVTATGVAVLTENTAREFTETNVLSEGKLLKHVKSLIERIKL